MTGIRCSTGRLLRVGLRGRIPADRCVGGLLCAVAAGVLVPASPAFAVAQSFIATLSHPGGRNPERFNWPRVPARSTSTPPRTQITVNASFTGLTSNAIAGHIHAQILRPSHPRGTNAPVRFPVHGCPGEHERQHPDADLRCHTRRGAQAQDRADVLQHPLGELRRRRDPGSGRHERVVSGPGEHEHDWNMRNSLTTGQSTNSFTSARSRTCPLSAIWTVTARRRRSATRPGSSRSATPTARGAPTARSRSAMRKDSRSAATSTATPGMTSPCSAMAPGSALHRRRGTRHVLVRLGQLARHLPVTGDWNGDGTDGIGTYTYSTATWSLRNTATTGTAGCRSVRLRDAERSYPVVGDWDLDNDETVGTKTGMLWSLRNTNNAGAGNMTFNFGPLPGSRSVGGKALLRRSEHFGAGPTPESGTQSTGCPPAVRSTATVPRAVVAVQTRGSAKARSRLSHLELDRDVWQYIAPRASRCRPSTSLTSARSSPRWDALPPRCQHFAPRRGCRRTGTQ